MYCNYCGKVIQDDANVCAYCGTRVGAVLARKRLLRPRAGRKIAGVCLGVAEYFDRCHAGSSSLVADLDRNRVRVACLPGGVDRDAGRAVELACSGTRCTNGHELVGCCARCTLTIGDEVRDQWRRANFLRGSWIRDTDRFASSFSC